MTDLYQLLAVHQYDNTYGVHRSPVHTRYASGGVIYPRHEQPEHAHTPGLHCPAVGCRWALPVYASTAEAVADACRVAQKARKEAAEANERARRAEVRTEWVLLLAAVAVAVAAVALVGVALAFGGLL